MPQRNSGRTIFLPDFTVPNFHASLLRENGDIFISGGVLESEERETKSCWMSYFSLLAEGKHIFKPKFCQVKTRSSHSLCEILGDIYILGGYGFSESGE